MAEFESKRFPPFFLTLFRFTDISSAMIYNPLLLLGAFWVAIYFKFFLLIILTGKTEVR